MFTADTTVAVSLARHAPKTEFTRYLSADLCVAKVTGFLNVADMMDTRATYAPKFCMSRANPEEAAMMLKAAEAFNAEAERLGQVRRAVFF